MAPSRVDSVRRMALLGLVCSAAFFLAASVFVASVLGSGIVASFAYVIVFAIAVTLAAMVSAPLRSAKAHRVPRIPGGNARWSYRAVSRKSGTVMMGSAPTLV